MGKFKGKRWLAGAMAVMLCCSSFLQTGVFTVSAEAETEVAQEAVQEPMAVEKTEEELIAETVSDPSLALEIKQGTAFDVAKDFTGLGLKDGDRAELKRLPWRMEPHLILEDQGSINVFTGSHLKKVLLIWLQEPLP